MKFEFNIQINNQSHSAYKGKLEFRPEDFELVDLSTALDKAIYEYFEIPPLSTSEWYKTDIETRSNFDPVTFRPDIHFRSSIELDLEDPKSMIAAFSMEANATGKCYAFIEISAANKISITFNDQPTIDPTKMPLEAWTREH